MIRALIENDVARPDAEELAQRWVRVGDYLFDAPTLPSADFVIGNPPYIRLEDMDEALASTYRGSYRTMKGRADIYVAFFEAALWQLRPGGVCVFICADRWMLNQYGSDSMRIRRSAGHYISSRYELLCRRMVLERLYDAACLRLTTNEPETRISYPSEVLSFTRFVAELQGNARRFVGI